MLGLLGIPRLWLVGGAAAVILLGAAWIVHSIRKDAQSDLLHSIEKAEDDARRKAIEGARSVDACYDLGGMWDRSAGSCRLPQGGR